MAGGLAVLLALLMGNLRGLGWLAGVWRSLVTGRSLPEFDYWAASRVIPNTINEFPLWTFVFADLHPHMIAMPFGLLVVGLALNWVAVELETGSWKPKSGDSGSQGAGRGHGGREQREVNASRAREPVPRQFLVYLSTCLLIALALGALGVINTWDLPTYALLVAGACVVAGWRARRWLGAAGGAAAGGRDLRAWPWPPTGRSTRTMRRKWGRARVRWSAASSAGCAPASPLDDWLVIWGFFLLLAVCYVVVVWRRGAEERRSRGAGEQRSKKAKLS